MFMSQADKENLPDKTDIRYEYYKQTRIADFYRDSLIEDSLNDKLNEVRKQGSMIQIYQSRFGSVNDLQANEDCETPKLTRCPSPKVSRISFDNLNNTKSSVNSLKSSSVDRFRASCSQTSQSYQRMKLLEKQQED